VAQPLHQDAQVAIVTGAARGIGYAIAHKLGQEGAAVMVSDVDDTAAAAAVGNLKQQGIIASFMHCDVSSSEQVSFWHCRTSYTGHAATQAATTCSVLLMLLA
jgi:NAD(P)-dependent dehydrogenase (short-subunit alcohol dehydrogenase family)